MLRFIIHGFSSWKMFPKMYSSHGALVTNVSRVSADVRVRCKVSCGSPARIKTVFVRKVLLQASPLTGLKTDL